MIKGTDKNTALKKCQFICSKQEKCKAEIRQKLYEWKVDSKEHLWILNQLEKDNFINEIRYTGFFVRDKFKFNKWGKIKIEFELKAKQISFDIIANALDDIDETEYMETCENLLLKKLNTIKDEASKTKEKLFRFGQSKGFEPDIVIRLTEKIIILHKNTNHNAKNKSEPD